MTSDEINRVHAAMCAADNFARWARHHLGEGRAEQFEKARVRLIEALHQLPDGEIAR